MTIQSRSLKSRDKTEDRFLLVAHRGGLYHRPENTIAAFDYSLKTGIEWAEFDVRLASDGEPVLIHDEVITFPDGSQRPVRELDSSQLASLDVGSGERVPTLSSVFKRYNGRLNFDVEIKELDAVEKTIDLILSSGYSKNVYISSFIPEALQSAKDVCPDITRGLLVDRLTGRILRSTSAVKSAILLECEILLPHYTLLTREWISAAHSDGLRVISWTVNQLDDAKKMLHWGVDGLISDRPDYLIPIIRQFRPEMVI